MADAERPRKPHAATVEKAVYAGLLGLLLASYLLTVAAPNTIGGGAAQLAVAAVALLLVGVGRRVRRLLGGWAGVVIAIAVAVGLAAGLSAAGVDGAADIVTALLLLGAGVATLDRLLRVKEITVDTVLAALSIYLLLAFAFASVFSAVQDISGEAFFSDGRFGDRSEFLYFSVVTMTTLGYGDFVSAGSLGRGISALEALTGQLFLGTVVARFVGLLRVPSRASS